MNRWHPPSAGLADVDCFGPAWIGLDGVVNMRDLGGLPTSDGRHIRPRRLIRSDNLQDLTAGDIRTLLSFGVTDVVDLRAAQEVDAEGPGPLREAHPVKHHHHSLLPDRDRAATAADALAASARSADEEEPEPAEAGTGADASEPDSRDGPAGRDGVSRRDVVRAGQYRGYLTHRPDSVTAALRVIADSRGATVVHCAAGKDRTGVVVALALDIAAVPHEAIVADYARSAERVRAILTRLARSDFYAADPATYSVPDQTPTPGSMRLFLAALTEQVGGADGWLRRQGWDADDVGKLRTKLTTESKAG